MVLLACVALALGCAALTFVLVERRGRWRWQEVEVGRLPVERAGLYRDGGSVPVFLRRAPLLVRAAAFSCLLFGQMLVPFAAVALFGMFYFGSGFAAIPLLVVTGQLYGTGHALLRRAPGSYPRMRASVRWALWLYAILGLLTLCGAVMGRLLGESGATFGALAVAGYSLLSLVQALFCRFVLRRHQHALTQDLV